MSADESEDCVVGGFSVGRGGKDEVVYAAVYGTNLTDMPEFFTAFLNHSRIKNCISRLELRCVVASGDFAGAMHYEYRNGDM